MEKEIHEVVMADMKEQRFGSVVVFFASIVTVLSGVGIIISLLYDMGYYTKLGYPVAELPTTFSDHIRSSINWLSPLLWSLFIVIILELVTRKIEKGQTEEELVSSSSNPKRVAAFRNSPFWFMALLCLLILCLYILFGDSFLGGMPFASFGVWIVFSMWSMQCPLIESRWPIFLRRAIIVIPACFLFAYFSGKQQAVNDTNNASNITVFYLTDGVQIKARVLRSLDRGFLIRREGRKNIEVLAIGAVLRLERDSEMHIDAGLIGGRLSKAGEDASVISPNDNYSGVEKIK